MTALFLCQNSAQILSILNPEDSDRSQGRARLFFAGIEIFSSTLARLLLEHPSNSKNQLKKNVNVLSVF